MKNHQENNTSYHVALVTYIRANQDKICHSVTPLGYNEYIITDNKININARDGAIGRRRGEYMYSLVVRDNNRDGMLPNLDTYNLQAADAKDRAAAIDFSREIYDLMKQLYNNRIRTK